MPDPDNPRAPHAAPGRSAPRRPLPAGGRRRLMTAGGGRRGAAATRGGPRQRPQPREPPRGQTEPPGPLGLHRSGAVACAAIKRRVRPAVRGLTLSYRIFVKVSSHKRAQGCATGSGKACFLPGFTLPVIGSSPKAGWPCLGRGGSRGTRGASTSAAPRGSVKAARC